MAPRTNNDRPPITPRQRLAAFAPNCRKCQNKMKFWMALPDLHGEGNLVVYRCDECDTEFKRTVLA
jgi:hypothetical protein